MTNIIELKNVNKWFDKFQALKNVSLEVKPQEKIVICGPSGSGKSTLMHLIGCLDTPTKGEYFIDGQDVAHLSGDELAKIRNEKIGFVFQKFNLLPDLKTLANVALPLLYAKKTETEANQKAKELLIKVGLENRINHYPYQLSGGQQQRVAISRSLVSNPSVILADEPTGNLDSQTGESVIEIFKKLHQLGKTIILVTHEMEIAKKTNRIIELLDGKIISDKKI